MKLHIFPKLNNKGVTMLELIIVMAIIAVLVALAMPSLAAYHRNSLQIEEDNVEALVQKAVNQYYAFEGRFPSLGLSGNSLHPLTEAQQDDLKNELMKRTKVRLDVETFDYNYNPVTGECTVERH